MRLKYEFLINLYYIHAETATLKIEKYHSFDKLYRHVMYDISHLNMYQTSRHINMIHKLLYVKQYFADLKN